MCNAATIEVSGDQDWLSSGSFTRKSKKRKDLRKSHRRCLVAGHVSANSLSPALDRTPCGKAWAFFFRERKFSQIRFPGNWLFFLFRRGNRVNKVPTVTRLVPSIGSGTICSRIDNHALNRSSWLFFPSNILLAVVNREKGNDKNNNIFFRRFLTHFLRPWHCDPAAG